MTEDLRAQQLADTEAVLISGWTRRKALQLAEQWDVTESTTKRWRRKVQEEIRKRALPGATHAATLEDTLERLEVVFARAMEDGRLNIARAVTWDRARLLDQVPRHRVEVSGGVTIDVHETRRVDVSHWPVELLQAVARGVDDGDLERMLLVADTEELDGVIIDVEPAQVAAPAEPSDESDDDE